MFRDAIRIFDREDARMLPVLEVSSKPSKQLSIQVLGKSGRDVLIEDVFVERTQLPHVLNH